MSADEGTYTEDLERSIMSSMRDALAAAPVVGDELHSVAVEALKNVLPADLFGTVSVEAVDSDDPRMVSAVIKIQRPMIQIEGFIPFEDGSDADENPDMK